MFKKSNKLITILRVCVCVCVWEVYMSIRQPPPFLNNVTELYIFSALSNLFLTTILHSSPSSTTRNFF